MSEGHPQQKLGLGWEILLGPPFGDLLLGGGIVRGRGLVWGACTSRSRGLRNQYIHKTSIIDGP